MNNKQEPHFAQASFSSETEPTVWKTIPILELLQDNWETMLNVEKFAPVCDAIEKGLEKLQKWYMRIDESDTYFICLGMCCLMINSLASSNLLSSLASIYQA